MLVNGELRYERLIARCVGGIPCFSPCWVEHGAGGVEIGLVLGAECGNHEYMGLM